MNEIGFKGYSIPLDSGVDISKIKSDLTVKPIENPNYESWENKSFKLFRISKTRIYVPRYYGLTTFGKCEVTFPELPKVVLPFNGILREIQLTTVSESLKNYNEYYGGIVSLDTGLGKTVVALKIISEIGLKTLIIVHAQFLLEQWIERIRTFLPTARIGIIRQDQCEYTDCDICVGMLQSIIKREYPDECMRSFGHVTIDECHHLSSKTFSSIFFKVQAKYMLGLSATPERKDGLSKVFYYFLGPQIVNIKRTSDKPEILFNKNTEEYPERLTRQGKANIPAMITDLTLCNTRNELIISLIQEYLLQNRKILLLSHRRAHCLFLNEKLRILGIDSGVYLGGMKMNDRNDNVKKSVILGTYQASGEGFDVPELDTLILSTPRSDVEQAVGRILRQKNNNTPLVIDITDSGSIFKGQYYLRRKFYISSNFRILK